MADITSTVLFWSLPAAISLHVFDEFAYPGGLIRWIKDFKPRTPRSNLYYFNVNAAAIVATTLIAAFAADHRITLYMYLYFSGLMAGNAASHLRGAVQMRRYCPGALTAGFLLIPLFAISCRHFFRIDHVNLTSAILWACAGLLVGWFVFGVDVRKERCQQKTTC